MKTTTTVVDAVTGETLGLAGASLLETTGTVPAYLLVLGGERTWHLLLAEEVAELEESGETVKLVAVSQ